MSANPFDEFKPATSADPFDEFQRANPPVKTVLKAAATFKPDDMAEAERLAKRYPAPVDALYRNLSDVRLQEAVDKADERLRTSPKLAEALARNPRLATMAQDDVEPLAQVEQFMRDVGGAAKAGVFRASRGAAGTFQAGLELVAPALDIFEPADPLAKSPGLLPYVPLPGGNPLRRLAEGFALQGGAAGETAKTAMPKTEGNIAGGFFSGIQSLTQNLLALPMAFLPGGQGAALGMMTAGTGGDAYQTAREKGLPMSQALPFAASQAAIEYATEKLPLSVLLKDVKAGASFISTLGRQIALEVPGEQIATVLQDLNEWAILNPDKPFSSYLEDRPSAAAQTLVATIVGTGGNVTVAKGIEAVVERMSREGANMQRAGVLNKALEDAFKAAQSSALRERSPEQFRALMQQMGDDATVWVDAEVLNQLPADVLQQMEGVAAELPAALAINAPVPVKVADALTLLPGSTGADVFLQNARVAPEAPSFAEAEAASQRAGEFLQQEAARVIAQAQDQEALRASAEAVRTSILSEINATGRYRPAVAEGMSQWLGAFYTTMASRVGMTPEAFYQQHRVRILGAPSATASGPVMDQGPSPEALAEAAALEAEARRIQLGVRARTKAERDAGAEQISDTTLAANRADGDRAFALLTRAQELRKPPVVQRERAAPRWFGEMADTQRAAVDSLPEWDGADGFSLRRPGESAEDDVFTSASSNFTDYEVVPGVRSVPLEKLGDLGGYDDAREQKRIAALAERMREDKEITPIFVGVDETGDLSIMEGQHRARAFKAMGMQSIPAKIVVDFSQGRYEQQPPNAPAAGGAGELQQADQDWTPDTELAKAAVEVFGKTYNPKEAGYVLPDGTMLDFSGRHYSGKDNWPYLRNQRSVDHRELHSENVATGKSLQGMLQSNGGSEAMYEFMARTGAMRVDFNAGVASIARPPTPRQINALATVLRDNYLALSYNRPDGEIVVDTDMDSASAIKIRKFFDQAMRMRGGTGALAQAAAAQPRGTFNPQTLELVLNPNADLSTWFHETGHFFLEVLADVASQPDAPAQIVEDMATFLKWAGIKDLATWNALDLDGKRKYHERWAESIEQYVMEGKAPSVELQPLMRRFATWLKSVYGSIKRFLEMRGQGAAGGETLGQSDETLRLFHGTRAEFAELSTEFSNENNEHGDAVYLTDRRSESEKYGSRVLEKRLSGKVLDEESKPGEVLLDLADELSDMGYEVSLRRAERASSTGTALEEIRQQISSDPREGNNIINEALSALGYVARSYEEASGARSYAVWDTSVLAQDGPQQPGPQMALNDDIRRVMDRMLATDEQIAQANEVAGLTPDVEADATAAERLAKRSIADLKWSVKARDQAIAKLRKQAAAIEKDIREQVTAEVDGTPEMRAKRALDALKVTPEYAAQLAEHKARRKAAETATRDEVKAALLAENPDAKGLIKGQLLAKNKRDIDNKVEAAMIKWDAANPEPKRPVNTTDADVATIADSFGFESVDAMLQSIDAFGSRRDAIDGMTERRMLEEHGDLIDERAIAEAANEAVHNAARARSLATELRTQAEMLNTREDTGQTNAKGSKITVNALVEAAKQFGANVVARTQLRDLKSKAWQHTAAERRAAKRWTEATAAGKTAEAVQAKQDQMINHAAAKAAMDAQAEARKILDFFKRVTKGNDETVVEKGRDPDIVNAARAVLAAYGVQTPASKGAAAYLETLKTNDPDTFAALEPMVAAATANAQPLEALTFEELQGLAESVQAMWHLAKRSRQMEVDGNLLDIDDAAQELFARMEEIGIPDRIPGEGMAVTRAEERGLFLKQGIAFLRRVEQWAEGMDGKYGGPFLRLVFQPIKDAADRYRKDRIAYRKKFQALVDNLAPIVGDSVIQAPELGYTFGTPGSTAGTAMNEILHAIAHTGNESNKRKLLLGRGWATENPDGTLDTSRWDAFLRRLANEGKLERAHYDFVQGVWDLLEETKPLAQKAHRDAFGRFFNEVTADTFVDPFGVTRAGGYVPAQVDSRLVKDNALRKLAEEENNSMAFAFPQPAKGFTMARVEYNRPLLLDLRGLSQHIDKVLLFGHMTNPARDVRKLLTRKTVSQPLDRIQPAAIESMIQPWLQRSAQQIVEDPIVGSGKWARLPGIIRSRAGMALMFANVSNTLQQITGLAGAAVRVKPSFLMRSLAQYVASPVQFSRAVWEASPYMDDRAKNEVAVMNEQMQVILLKPSVYERAQDWSLRHAYFLQTAFDNVLSPIVWTGAYNQALADGMSDADAVRFADGTVRQTQGSTLPEDVSRFETGPAYARAFTQFVSYFNMMANTNGTALKQIAGEVGLKKGAGKALYVVTMGFMIPIWVAEAIALAFRGGPEDEDEDGYLDDWLASVFGMGTLKGLLAQIPVAGQFGVAAANRFNDNPMDDRVSLSPAISLLESSISAPESVYKAIVEDGSKQKAIRDVATLVSVATGIPVYAVARPVGYLAGVEDDRIVPTSELDFARGLITGTASPDSKQR